MSIQDRGPNPNVDIETATVQNDNYRVVAWTGEYLQVTLMSVPPGKSIGLEAHPETDQFLRIEAGHGRCVVGPEKDALDFEEKVAAGWSIQVPGGTWHDVINAGTEPLRLYAVYAPAHHAVGAVHPTTHPSAVRKLVDVRYWSRPLSGFTLLRATGDRSLAAWQRTARADSRR